MERKEFIKTASFFSAMAAAGLVPENLKSQNDKEVIEALREKNYKSAEEKDLKMGRPFDYETEFCPKRENRWFVEFPKEFGIEVWKAQEITYPKYYKHKNYVGVDNKKKYRWDIMSVKLIDTIGPSTSSSIYHNIIKKDIKKFRYFIYGQDPTGVEIEKWEINGELDSIDFGSGSYSSDNLKILTISLYPVTCELIY